MQAAWGALEFADPTRGLGLLDSAVKAAAFIFALLSRDAGVTAIRSLMGFHLTRLGLDLRQAAESQ